jgi:hypothetical protein
MAPLSSHSEVLIDVSASADSAPIQKLLYTRKESAYALGLSVRSIDLIIAAGELKVRRFGPRRVLIPVEEIARYANKDHRYLTQHPDGVTVN